MSQGECRDCDAVSSGRCQAHAVQTQVIVPATGDRLAEATGGARLSALVLVADAARLSALVLVADAARREHKPWCVGSSYFTHDSTDTDSCAVCAALAVLDAVPK